MLAGIGLLIGIGGALWLTHFLAGFLFGVKAMGSNSIYRNADFTVRSCVASSLDSGEAGDARRSDDRVAV